MFKENQNNEKYSSEYGSIWESRPAEDWINFNLSLSEIAGRFQTTTLLIVRHAIRQNLPINTDNTRQVEGCAHHRIQRNYLPQNVEKYRADWERVIKKYPKLNRKQLLLQTRADFNYLKHKDKIKE